MNKILHGNCLELMKDIESESIDMILCDLPYGLTNCKWDSIIDLNKLWSEYKRIAKKNTAIVLTASQPFTSKLVMSNLSMFKHEWIWEKASGSNFASLKYQPMKEHESILIFCKSTPQYYPIKQPRKGSGAKAVKNGYKKNTSWGGIYNQSKQTNRSKTVYDPEFRCPSSVQYFNNRESSRGLHPTQKPVKMFEYLIKTYTQPNMLVLDNCIGSGTTAIACINTNRKFIGIESELKYVEITNQRIKNHEQSITNCD